jgi:hypothetical protein
MKIPRTFHWLLARALGYFWQPCPGCGRNFGGHEIAHDFRNGVMGGAKDTVDAATIMIVLGCPDCNKREGLSMVAANPHGVSINDVFPLAKYALHSGRLLMNAEKGLAGWPPDFMGGWDGIAGYIFFWRKYLILGNVVTWASAGWMILSGNPWCWAGMALGFLLQAIAMRALPIDPTRPVGTVVFQLLNLTLTCVYVFLAIHHLRHP